ncbi:elongation factor P hydroxylase [Enterobacter hormaechei]|uniref:Probable membrane transporter protein n=2 Tax=Enterobacteriaceae TaxID=543 RepID=A0A927DIK9_9ENTR|nr:elongation factor P hydroxylase [Enterobacter hormaechei]
MLAGFIDALGGRRRVAHRSGVAGGRHEPCPRRLPPTNSEACGGSLSSSLYFIRRKVVNLADQKLNILMTFIGSTAGALLVQHVQSDILRQILPLLVICIGLYFLLMPKLGEEDRQRRLHGLPFALIAGGCVGFYDGFFGPGAGSFYALAFVTLAGFNLAKSTAHAKVLNATSNVGGLLLFIIGGKVIWATGFVMMAGQFLGARAGSRLVLSKGQKLIRPMIVVVSAVMSAKLLYDSHGQEILTPVGDELMNSTHNYEQLIEIFDSCFADDFNTRLIKGDDEPIYLPADDEVPYNRIIFAHGFYASGLHEISHWCIAGKARRELVDFGYWYCPDGRDAATRGAV